MNLFKFVFLILFLFPLISSCEKKDAHLPANAQITPVAVETVDRIILAGGGVIEGKIVEETPEMVRIEWQNGIVGFTREEIQSVEKAVPKTEGPSGGIEVPVFESEESKKAKWPEGADDLVYLKNGERLEGKIEKETENILTLRQPLKEGGAVIQDLDLSKIEKIELWPPDENPGDRFKAFQERNAKFQLLNHRYYHVLTTEQDQADLKVFLRGLDQIYYDFLMSFLNIIDAAKSHEPLDVIIFGTRQEFDQALKEIGFNLKSNPIGFYHFNAKKLVFYNAKTDSAVRANIAQSQREKKYLEHLGEKLEDYGDAASAARGQIQEAVSESERRELATLAEARSRTDKVIRHEGAHQLFHLLGLTPTERYQGGWLVEGLAVYCETSPIGDIHEQRLMEVRFALERNELMPLEHLINFGRGVDFHKMDPLYAYLAYAESWGFIYFLTHSPYRDSFFNYLRDLSQQGPDFDEKADRLLLEKHLGKNIKEVEADFIAAIKKWVSEHTSDKIYQEYKFRLTTAG